MKCKSRQQQQRESSDDNGASSQSANNHITTTIAWKKTAMSLGFCAWNLWIMTQQ